MSSPAVHPLPHLRAFGSHVTERIPTKRSIERVQQTPIHGCDMGLSSESQSPVGTTQEVQGGRPSISLLRRILGIRSSQAGPAEHDRCSSEAEAVTLAGPAT
jgi:hypothetical protein